MLHVQREGRCDLADIYSTLVAQGQMIGHEVFNRFYEIGTPESLEETRRYLAGKSSSSLMSEKQLCHV